MAAEKHRNGSFSSTFGFVLACVGSAVGLGNIWLFPYRLGQYGGGAFLIPYLLFVFLFGWVGLSAEFGIGRLCKTGTLGAYAHCFEKRGRKKLGGALGWIPLAGSLGIAIGYAIIVGWVVRSSFGAITGSLLNEPDYFSQATGSFGSLPWHVIVVAAVCLILLTGATKNIEKASKVMMPLFFVLFLVVAVRVGFLPGAAEGYKFLFQPDWSKLLDPFTWVMAMGQAFFSLSITGSGMIVYGAYLGKDADIPKAALQTAFFDTCAALLSALAIMPAVFSFGIDPTSGPSLLFITLPGIFRQMPMGQVFAVVFFVSVIFAGLTSLINMFEAVSESWQTKFKISRTAAVLVCGAIVLAVGVFLEAEPLVGGWMDFITIVVVPIGAMLGAVAVYYVLGFDDIRRELELGRKKPLSPLFAPCAKFIYVPLTVVILVLGFVHHGIG